MHPGKFYYIAKFNNSTIDYKWITSP
jgi:hypothetical protein